MANSFGLTKSEMGSVLGGARIPYDIFVNNVLSANRTMIGLYNYWGGTKYNEIVIKWNNLVPFLNAFMENAGKAFNFMSDATKVYTEADSDVVDKDHVDLHKARKLDPKKSDDLTSTTDRMRADKDKIVKELGTARDNVDNLLTALINSPAYSKGIDDGKYFMEVNQRLIRNGIDDVATLIEENMTADANRYDEAEGKIRKGTGNTKSEGPNQKATK